MSNTTITYPSFEPNQVLTDSHLNDLREYLDQEIKWGRTQLTGMGIVCGLDLLRQEGEAPLIIRAGTGISSEGFLVTFRTDCPLRYYRPYSLPDGERYDFFKDITLYEALRNLPEEPNGEVELSSPDEGFDLDEMGVLLFLEMIDQDHDSCLGRSCDEIGKTRILTVRKLLVAKDDLLTIAAAGGKVLDADETLVWHVEADDALQVVFPGKRELPELSVPRVLLAPGSPATQNYGDFIQAYAGAMQTGYEALFGTEENPGALAQAYDVFEPLLAPLFEGRPFDGPAFWSWMEDLQRLYLSPVDAAANPAIQYSYHLLRDLVQGYNEFRAAAQTLLYECVLDTSRFPRHLMLGAAAPRPWDPCNPDPCRHGFIQPPIHNDQREDIREVRCLFERLVHMVQQANLGLLAAAPAGDRMRIIPAGSPAGPLGLQSIAYYYSLQEDTSNIDPLARRWHWAYYRYCRAARNRSYHADHYSTLDLSTQPLLQDIAPYNFFKVEGHQGLLLAEAQEAWDNISDKRQLPFRLSYVRMSAGDPVIALPADCTRSTHLQADYLGLRTEITTAIYALFDSLWRLNLLPIALPYEEEEEARTETALAVIEALPKDFTDFQQEEFQEQWTDMSTLIARLYLNVAEWRRGFRITQKDLADPVQYENLMDHTLLLVEKMEAFLAARYDARLLTLSTLRDARDVWMNANATPTLSQALAAAPAEHLAGCYRDGELLLVYHQIDGESRIVADLSRRQACCSSCPEPPAALEEDLCFPPAPRVATRAFDASDASVKIIGIQSLLNDLNAAPLEESEAGGFAPAGYTITDLTGPEEPLGETELAEDGLSIRYIPDPDIEAGIETWRFTIAHEECGKAEGTLTILIMPPLVPPMIATDDQASTTSTRSVNIPVLNNDRNYPANVQILLPASSPNNAALKVMGRTVQYLPQPGRGGQDTFSYTLRDPQGLRPDTTARVTVYVNGTDTCSYYTKKGEQAFFYILSNQATDTVETGFRISKSISIANTRVRAIEQSTLFVWPAGEEGSSIRTPHGTAAIEIDLRGNARVNYQPAPDFTGIDTFGYRVTSARGGVTSCLVEVFVDCCGTEVAPCDVPAIARSIDVAPETITINFADEYPGITPVAVGATDSRFITAAVDTAAQTLRMDYTKDILFLDSYEIAYTAETADGQTCGDVITLILSEAPTLDDIVVVVTDTSAIPVIVAPTTFSEWKVSSFESQIITDALAKMEINADKTGFGFMALAAFFEKVSDSYIVGYQLAHPNRRGLISGRIIFQNRRPVEVLSYERFDQPTPEDNGGFGNSVALSEKIFLTGSPGYSAEDISSQGAGYLYFYDGIWTEEYFRLTVAKPQLFDLAGYAVAIGTEVLYMSVPVFFSESEAFLPGYIQAYIPAGGGEAKQLPPASAEKSPYQFTGVCLDAWENFLIAGSVSESPKSTAEQEILETGIEMYFFEGETLQMTGFEALSEAAPTEMHFTKWVAVDGNLIAVGVPGLQPATQGGVALFRSDFKGSTETTQKLQYEKGSQYFGLAVALRGEWLAVTDVQAQEGQHPGSVIMYTVIEAQGAVEFHSVLSPPDDFNPGHIYGFSVALHGEFLAVGCPPNLEELKEPGTVYLYKFNGEVWELSGEYPNPEPEENDVYGISVSLNGRQLAVGSGFPSITGEGLKPGKAYVIDL